MLETAPKTVTATVAPGAPESNFGKWMALTAALLGWMFDGFEMGLFPLIGGPALNDLLGPASAAQATQWFGAIIAVFLVGAATGGVFFGWLGDRIGRVRAMALSIFTYAIFTGLCGFATEAWHIAALRFVASLGMGGEWSLGVALVNEIWPNKSRALIAGLIGAAANLGFLMVGLLSIGLHSFIGGVEALLLGIGMPTAMVERLLANSGWRFLMISGALPALLVFFIRLFVPESKKWEHEKARGATSHWSNGDLLGVSVGCLASIAIIWSWSPAGTGPAAAAIITVFGVAAALWGFLFPVRRYLARAVSAGSLAPQQQRIVIRHMLLGAGLAGVALLGTWGSIQWAPRWAFQLEPDPSRFSREYTQISSALGAIVFPILAGVVAGKIRPPHHLRGPVRGLDSFVPAALPGQRPLRRLFPVLDFSGRRHHRGILRMVSAVSARALPDCRARDRAGVLLQLRPHPRCRRRSSDRNPDGLLRRKLSDGGLGADGLLRGGADHHLVRAGDVGQAIA